MWYRALEPSSCIRVEQLPLGIFRDCLVEFAREQEARLKWSQLKRQEQAANLRSPWSFYILRGPVDTGHGAPCHRQAFTKNETFMVNGSVHTSCKQHPRVCMQICFCVLCELVSWVCVLRHLRCEYVRMRSCQLGQVTWFYQSNLEFVWTHKVNRQQLRRYFYTHKQKYYAVSVTRDHCHKSEI